MKQPEMVMKLTLMATLPKQQMKKNICVMLAAAGLMLGSFANAAVIHADDLYANGGYGKAAHSLTQLVANDSAQSIVSAHDKDRVEMADPSSRNGNGLPEPGPAALLVLAVLAMGVVRGRLIC